MGKRIPIRIAMSTIPTWKSKIANLWLERPKAAEWRLPFALFICATLAYGAAFAWHMLANFDLILLIGENGSADDAFYYFQIAYNLAQGKFSTFDGGITQTNGYQPVWLLLITPFYWFFDKETALFGIKAFEIMLVAGGAALIAVAARVARLAWPLLFAALPTLYHNPLELLWGLEAAAAMFALALLILAVCLYMRAPERWKWHLAAVAFALPWVRIEYIAISLAATAALCAIEWSRQERRSLRPSALANLRRAYIPMIGAIAGTLVYFAYNGLVFGSVLPVSAAVKLAWSQARWASEGGYDFIENLRYMIRYDAFDLEILLALEICAYLLLVWRLALRSNDRRDWLLVAFLVGAFGLAAGHIAKFAQAVLTVHPNTTGIQIWHFVPAYLMTALIIPVRLYIAICLIRRFVVPQRRIAANALSAVFVVIGAAVLIGRTDFAEPFRWVDRKSGSTEHHWEHAVYMGAQVTNRALPEGSVIGSWDAGVIGYFSRFPVVNLDGLVNSYDYFRARYIQHSEVRNFYRRYGITHFANVRWYDRIPNNVIFEGARHDTPGYGVHQFALWTYDPAPDAHVEIDYSRQIWERLEPRFDHSLNGVGIVLAGRMAQAFAKDCPPDEPLIWTWAEPKHERTVRLETVPHRSRANICADARILPRGAGRTAQAKMRSSAYADVDVEALASREPIIRSDFDVHLIDDNLIYIKAQCDEADVEARFFASVFPVDPNYLSNRNSGYDSIDFDFHDYGAIAADGRCWAAVDLPNYPIDKIEAGQYVESADSYTHIWVGSYGESAYEADVEVDIDKFEMLAEREPIIRSDFDVYIIGDSLIYAKTDCSQADVEARFYASVTPLYEQSLSEGVRQRGYDGIDFSFDDYGAIAADGQCWAAARLPDYPIATIRTGQYTATPDIYNYLWEAAYRVGPEPDFDMLADHAPIIRSRFDVYLIDGSLIHAKSQCSPEDTMARFYISISPVDVDDLPDNRRQRGYDGIEFNFAGYGAITDDGRCWAETNLPDYPIATIRTGQYTVTADGYNYLWEAAHRLE